MVDKSLTQPATESVILEPRRRILIVEDDADQLAALIYRLNKLGYDATSACSAQQAFELATSINPDLILLDLCLPDADGLDVCEQLGDTSTTCAVPVIILSGQETEDIVRRARAAGCTYYLRKPYDPNVLLTLIERALGSAQELDW